jgi:hypothetical protein
MLTSNWFRSLKSHFFTYRHWGVDWRISGGASLPIFLSFMSCSLVLSLLLRFMVKS